jgi:hypothetical protein
MRLSNAAHVATSPGMYCQGLDKLMLEVQKRQPVDERFVVASFWKIDKHALVPI